MRVLVVEDFEVLAAAIGTGLRREGMAVDVALDGDDALEHLAVTRYDVVVLDRDLPGTHGDEVCRRLVAGPSGSRVLMLTAASTVQERVGRVIAGIQANTQAQEIRAAATLIGLVVLSLAAGWLIAGWFLRPLRTITATARDISAVT